MSKSIPEELKNTIKEEYETTGLSLTDLADKYSISIHSLKQLRQQENWAKQKVQNSDLESMLITIRDILYESIVHDWTVSKLIDTQKVNSFIGLVSKTEVTGGTEITSKSDLQKILDSINES